MTISLFWNNNNTRAVGIFSLLLLMVETSSAFSTVFIPTATSTSTRLQQQQKQPWMASRLFLTTPNNLYPTDDDDDDNEDGSTNASKSLSSSSSSYTTLDIEYCTGCRWMLKSFWMAQEILTTFEQSSHLNAVSIIPNRGKEGGVFTVSLKSLSLSLSSSEEEDVGTKTTTLLWDRSKEGGFPTTKKLKQFIRDKIEPEQFLGHSDTVERQDEEIESATGALFAATAPSSSHLPGSENDILTSQGSGSGGGTTSPELALTMSVVKNTPSPAVTITYCTGCKWLLRAAYFGQELLTTFAEELNSVTLIPSKPPSKGGQFTIALNGNILFDRTTEGRFPEVKEIKQLIRDALVPSKDLGHSDTPDRKEAVLWEETLSDEDAAEQRSFYGVA